MQVGRRTTGHHDFVVEGTDKSGLHPPEAFSNPEPWTFALRPPIDSTFTP